MLMKKTLLLYLLSAFMMSACRNNIITEPTLVWADSTLWYQSDNQPDTTKVDVIYYISTEVISAQDPTGHPAWQSSLCESDRQAMTAEMAWIEKNMFDGDFNYVSPYYHQFTFDALSQLETAQFDSIYHEVAQEACASLDYYLTYINRDRPFILAGFSQGAMLTIDMLKHMTDEQYERMVACYCIGYKLTQEDLQHPHIKAAQDESDLGVVISFNSTQTLDAVWPFVSEGTQACINPINWKTDATPATFVYEGASHTVHVDQEKHVLVVQTEDPTPYYDFMDKATVFSQAGVKRDNLHHWDFLFYNRQIHDNALLRYAKAQQASRQ